MSRYDPSQQRTEYERRRPAPPIKFSIAACALLVAGLFVLFFPLLGLSFCFGLVSGGLIERRR
ncbi:hypothetical protein [Halocatena halophila]|uniref:hypothetical protein n=1 Tax=Halocatena halophila TaxID=2814576 RepID=UPI002ED019F8